MAWLKFHDLTFVVSRESERVVAVLPCQGCLALNSTQNLGEGGDWSLVGEESGNYNSTTHHLNISTAANILMRYQRI